MDDELKEFAELEAELKRLKPAASVAALRARLEHELAAPNERARRTASLWWLLAALPPAAAIAIAITLGLRRPAAPERAPEVVVAPSFKPVAAENVLVDARDEGYVTLADGTPGRRVRQSSVDTITWKNPRTNASLRWTLPREEVRVVPVIFQ